MSVTTRIAAILVCLSVVGSAQSSQTLPAGFETTLGGGATSWPFNTTLPQRWQWCYDSDQFQDQQCITIHEISVRAAQPGITVQPYNMGMYIRMGSASADYGGAAYPNAYGAAVVGGFTVVHSGAFVGPATPPQAGGMPGWIPLQMQTPFVYDPSRGNDLVVDITRCGGGVDLGTQIDMATGAIGVTGGQRYGSTDDCLATSWSFTHQGAEWVPVIRIEYTLGGSCTTASQWMRNTPEATLGNDGDFENGPEGPIISSACVGTLRLINLQSSLQGMPWDIAMVEAPAIPGYGGGTTFPSGQSFNLDPFDPSFVLARSTLFVPPIPAFPLLVPYVGLQPGVASAQLVVADLSLPEGWRVSAPGQFETVNDVSVVLDPLDENERYFAFGAAPFCGQTTIPFYGTSYSGLWVSSNGRISFGGPGPGFAPSIAAARIGPAFIGAWADLQPNLGGTISVTEDGPELLRMDVAQVPYFGGGGATASFTLLLHAPTGVVALADLLSLQSAPMPMFLGMSPGNGATDPGPTPFVPWAPQGSPSSPDAMIYQFGPAGSLASGVWALIFVPDGAGSYLHSAF